MIEYVDIVDDNDVVIGQTARLDNYLKMQAHRIIHVLLFDKQGRMALQLRSKTKPFCPGHWSTAVGGYVTSGESYEESARRECIEELGVEVPLTFARKELYIDERGNKKFLTVYHATYEGPFSGDPQEVERIEFFAHKQIAQMIASGEKFHPELLFLLEKEL